MISLLLLLLSVAPTLAAPPSDKDDPNDCGDFTWLSIYIRSRCDSQHLLPIGAGVASPTTGSSFLENPAGLFYHKGLKLHGATALAPGSYVGKFAAALFGSNLASGFRASVHSFGSLLPVPSQGSAMVVGAAQELRDLGAALGFSGSLPFSTSGGVLRRLDRTYANSVAGVIFNHKGKFRVGLTAIDVIRSAIVVGGGFVVQPNRTLMLSLDALAATKTASVTLKPTLSLSTRRFQFTAGYGKTIGDDESSARVATRLSLGAALVVNEYARFVLAINQIDALYLAATVKM